MESQIKKWGCLVIKLRALVPLLLVVIHFLGYRALRWMSIAVGSKK